MSGFFRASLVVAKSARPSVVAASQLSSAPQRFQSARKRLGQHGVQALLPSAIAKYPSSNNTNKNSPVVDVSLLPSQERIWRPPLLSKRKAAVLRKEAKRLGTYGSFDAEKGLGWDPSWDVELAMANPRCLGRYTVLRVPKKSAQRRSREERARNIEAKMVGMDERMEELQAARQKNKPQITFEYTYKELMKVKK